MLTIERNETQLVKKAVAGDSNAFELLVSSHSGRVFRLALRMLGSREDAEDVQQETFVSAYRGLCRFRGDAVFGTWIYSIAVRICMSRLRRAARRSTAKPHDLELIIYQDEDPEQRLLALESAGRVQRTLARMMPADRLLIVLKYIEGLSHEEIAHVLGCSEASSRSRLLRAKKIFRERYEQVG